MRELNLYVEPMPATGGVQQLDENGDPVGSNQ
jgi:hypothetical protein